jgi:hypothetical protein
MYTEEQRRKAEKKAKKKALRKEKIESLKEEKKWSLVESHVEGNASCCKFKGDVVLGCHEISEEIDISYLQNFLYEEEDANGNFSSNSDDTLAMRVECFQATFEYDLEDDGFVEEICPNENNLSASKMCFYTNEENYIDKKPLATIENYRVNDGDEVIGGTFTTEIEGEIFYIHGDFPKEGSVFLGEAKVRMRLKNGDIYEGGLLNGKMNGKGKITPKNSSLSYRSNFVDGVETSGSKLRRKVVIFIGNNKLINFLIKKIKKLGDKLKIGRLEGAVGELNTALSPELERRQSV